MDPESKKLLEETLALARENNKMLHTIRRSMLWARVMSVLYWVVIIGIAFGTFYFIQPYIDQLSNIYGGAKNSLDSVDSILQQFQN